MSSIISPTVLLATLDQLIIRREITLTSLEEQLETLEELTLGRPSVEVAIAMAKTALERLAQKRAQIVMHDL